MTSSYSYKQIIQKEYDRVIPWLDEIPSHWDFVRSKTVFSQRKEFAKPDDIQLSATQAYGVISQKEYEKRVGRKVVQIFQHLEKRAHVEPDDFVISMRSFQGGLERAWERGCIRSSYVVLQPNRELDVNYFTHLFKSKAYIAALQATGNFIRDGQDLNFSNFTKVNLPLPPLQEQKTIGLYLNKLIKYFDSFITSKKKLITLLKEQKQVIINNAITKGINPSTTMRYSGIKWIGDIPEHWSLERTKSFFTPKKTILGNNHVNYRLLSLTLKGVIERDIESGKGKFPTDFSAYQHVSRNDFIFCLFDIDETPRTVGVSNLEGMITGAYNIYELTRNDRDYIYYYFLNIDNKKALKPLYTGLRKVIPESTFLQMKITIPPLNEQKTISNFLNSAIAQIDNAILLNEKKINLINEYQMKLISDAVTGKIDVRNIDIPDITDEEIPFEMDSPEISDEEMNIGEDE